MTTDRDRELLIKLAIPDPWSWSTEGLDDCCMFCQSEERRYDNPRYSFVHENGCVWLEAREHLGMQQPDHTRKDV